MFDLRDCLDVLSGVVFLIAESLYIRSIILGETKPARATWVVWVVLDAIAFAGMWWTESLNWQITAILGTTIIIVVLSWFYGIKKWSFLDKMTLVFAAISLLLWLCFNNAVLGIVISNGLMIVASGPTFCTAWDAPKEENRKAWTISLISCLLEIAALKEWTLSKATSPVTMLLIVGIMVFLLWLPRQKNSSVQDVPQKV